jgi:hypothetical protein
LAFDEIQTGLGQTGTLMAYHHDDVKPDMVVLGKALTGNVPNEPFAWIEGNNDTGSPWRVSFTSRRACQGAGANKCDRSGTAQHLLPICWLVRLKSALWTWSYQRNFRSEHNTLDGNSPRDCIPSSHRILLYMLQVAVFFALCTLTNPIRQER